MAQATGGGASLPVMSRKLVLLGESAVGKSSLVLRFVKQQFDDYRESTIGAAFLTQTVQLADRVVKFEIWDTAGQERYKSLAPMYYRAAACAVVVYDITSTASLERAKSWISELHRQADPSIIVCLVGNKSDLASTQRQVDTEEAKRYAQESNLMFFEASAKSGENVEAIFNAIAGKLPLDTSSTNAQRPRAANAGVDLAKEAQSKSDCAC